MFIILLSIVTGCFVGFFSADICHILNRNGPSSGLLASTITAIVVPTIMFTMLLWYVGEMMRMIMLAAALLGYMIAFLTGVARAHT